MFCSIEEVFPHWPWCWACGNHCWHSHCIEKTLFVWSWGLELCCWGFTPTCWGSYGGINNSNSMLSLEGVRKLSH
jgi:hypothetical protein